MSLSRTVAKTFSVN